MHYKILRKRGRKGFLCMAVVAIASMALFAVPRLAHSWSESDFEHRPLVAYPIPTGRDDLIGSLQSYTIRKGDTLLDVARWYGLSPTEVSNANNHMDWWAPPVGKVVVIPTEHILPYSPRNGIVMNIPEMRLYYYYPTAVGGRRRIGKGRFAHAAYAEPHHVKGRKSKSAAHGVHPNVIFTFPVGLGRYDWRTPTGTWTIRDKTYNPTWVVPDDIYQEHLERDGEAEHLVEGGDPDNPLGHYRLALTLPMYALHGTNVPWGVGMEVSHGCVRLYPEDIDRLYHRTSVGTPGRFVYQPVKYGWRGDSLYVEVHEDLYGVYPGLWRYALRLARTRGLIGDIDMLKLERAVEEKSGVPTYVMPGAQPPGAMAPTEETANSVPLPPPGSAASAPDADTSASSSLGASMGGPAADSDEGASASANEDKKASAAIPPPPVTDAIRPAPGVEPPDTGGKETIDDGEGDSSATASGEETELHKADSNPSAASSQNGASGDESGGDSAQWNRIPPGAMPVE
jgi:L,D-transpeptidase ErfK/SrfK